MTARVDAFAALASAITGGSLRVEDRRRLLRRILARIDQARKAERITALEARELRTAVNGHSTQGRDGQ